jgi:hypothetical protein
MVYWMGLYVVMAMLNSLSSTGGKLEYKKAISYKWEKYGKFVVV